MPSPPCFMLSSAPLPPSAVEGRVKEVDVLLIHAILGQAQPFSEPMKMHDLAGPQELDDVVGIGVVAEPQKGIVRDAGFLLRRQVFRQVSDEVSLHAYAGRIPR